MPHSPGGGAIDSRLTGRQRKTQTWSISASVFLSQNVEFTFVLCYSMQQKHLEKFGNSTDRRGKFSNGTGVSEAECLRRASGAA